MKIDYITLSDKGNFRKNNQDFVHAQTNEYGQFLAILCDGMGGHVKGEVASRIAVETFTTSFKKYDLSKYDKKQINKWLRQVVNVAKTNMERYAERNPESLDMGTTLTALLIVDDHGYVVNIGDSRTFKLLGNKLSVITKDQNLYNSTNEDDREIIMQNDAYPDHFNEITYWKILTSALGPTKTMKVDTYYIEDAKGTYMLTSDGIHDYIDSESVVEVLNSDNKKKAKAKEIIEIAKSNVSTDNMSIILVEVSNG